MSEPLTIRALTTQIHGELQGQLARAQVAAESEGAYAYLRANLAALGSSVSKLAPQGSITARLYDGSGYTFSEWRAFALELRSAIEYQLATMRKAAPTWGRFWTEVVVQTGKDSTDLAVRAGEGALALAPWVSVAIVALVAGYVVFSFKGLRS